MTVRPRIDWPRATLIAALTGGVFWGLTAGVILISKASATAITSICIVAAAFVVFGALMSRHGTSPANRTLGMGLALAPLTGLVPVIVVWLPGFLTHAIPWSG